MNTETIINDTCQAYASHLATAAKSCCNCASPCDNAIPIVLIICVTILLLGLMFSILIYKMRKKQLKSRIKQKEKELDNVIAIKEAELADKKEEEKKLYRSQLVNFLELRAKGIKRENDVSLDFKDKLCDQYIDELKSLLQDLTPKEDQPES